MSRDQAERLWARASELGPGAQVVEIGSYRGRSMTVLASAAPPTARLVAIDPHAGNDRGPQQWEGTTEEGRADNEAFWANLQRAGVADRVMHVRKPSQAALQDVAGAVDLLYIDGAHRFSPARADIVRWGARVPVGGTMLVHDSFSSIGVTFALLTSVTFGSQFRYAGRSRSLAEYRRVARLNGQDRVTNAGRQLKPLGWFVRNVALKVAIVARLRPVARWIGGGSDAWPY
ncbi:MAG: class I SAM-dependent methyltransferase [Solirubrobacteraceae bacterium]